MQILPLRALKNRAAGGINFMLCLLACAACAPLSTDHPIDANSEAVKKQAASHDASSAKKDDKTTKTPNITPFIRSTIDAAIQESPATNDTPQSTNVDIPILITGKKLKAIDMGASESPRNDGIHDTINDAIVVLQNPADAMKDFPRDRRQQVDWVQALNQGFIEPRADLLGESKMTTLDLDIIMKNTQFMPWIKFPHLKHTEWLACSNCHPAIFEAKEHANPITMNKVLRGEFCGVCHDKVAFALFTCERCHSVPHEGSGPKWW